MLMHLLTILADVTPIISREAMLLQGIKGGIEIIVILVLTLMFGTYFASRDKNHSLLVVSIVILLVAIYWLGTF